MVFVKRKKQKSGVHWSQFQGMIHVVLPAVGIPPITHGSYTLEANDTAIFFGWHGTFSVGIFDFIDHQFQIRHIWCQLLEITDVYVHFSLTCASIRTVLATAFSHVADPPHYSSFSPPLILGHKHGGTSRSSPRRSLCLDCAMWPSLATVFLPKSANGLRNDRKRPAMSTPD